MNDTQRVDWLESQRLTEILTNSAVTPGLPVRITYRAILGERMRRGQNLRDAIGKAMEGGEK
ncbi:MAG: hypothetical protein ACYC4K_10835 [Thiobacillus sp.]